VKTAAEYNKENEWNNLVTRDSYVLVCDCCKTQHKHSLFLG